MIQFDHVYNVFGRSPKEALKRLDAGESREAIMEATGHLIATEDVTLEVKQGEILVLMGLSGSGKSTLLRCANALVRPARGRVLYQHRGKVIDLSQVDEKTLREVRQNGISMVFQKFALLPWRTLRENVAFGLEVRGVAPAEMWKTVDAKLEMVGLGAWRDRRPAELSGGMQQRVGLARALATNPDLLLLDEPFGALDPLTRVKMQNELLSLQHELNKTMIFVSHDLDEALKLGTRVAIMEGGRLIQVGTPEEIVMRPATQYVRDFVAHVNPMNVFNGRSLMRPLAQLERDSADPAIVVLDKDGTRCRIDSDGRALETWVGPQKGRPVPYRENVDQSALGPGDLIQGDGAISMRTAIVVTQATSRPMILADGQGRLAGVISGREILRGLGSITVPDFG